MDAFAVLPVDGIMAHIAVSPVRDREGALVPLEIVGDVIMAVRTVEIRMLGSLELRFPAPLAVLMAAQALRIGHGQGVVGIGVGDLFPVMAFDAIGREFVRNLGRLGDLVRSMAEGAGRRGLHLCFEAVMDILIHGALLVGMAGGAIDLLGRLLLMLSVEDVHMALLAGDLARVDRCGWQGIVAVRAIEVRSPGAGGNQDA